MSIKKTSAAALFTLATMLGVQAQVVGTQAPSAQGQQQTEYTDADLQQFVKVVQAIQPMQMEFRQSMMALIQQSDLDMQAFQQMGQLQASGGDTTQFTAAQWGSFEKLRNEMKSSNAEMEGQIEAKVKEQGMDFEKFQKMSQAIQSNPQLAQKVRGMMQPQGQGQPQGQPGPR